MNLLLSLILSLALGALTSSCGWRLHPAMDRNSSCTMSIPYVEGDSSGNLTTQLVEVVQKEGCFRYAHSGGSRILKVRLVDDDILNIGWRLNPSGDKKKILPNESRKKLLAEVSVLKEGMTEPLLGPVYIKASIDYDHTHYAINNKANVFSLGQLTDIDTARDGLDVPMFRALAREINTFLLQHQAELL